MAVTTLPDAEELPTEIQRFIRRVEQRNSGTTRENNVRAAKRFGAWLNDRDLDPTDVRPGDVEDYVLDLYDDGDGLAPEMISGNRWVINMLYDDLERDDKVPENPVEAVDWRRYSEVLRGTKKAEHIDARGGFYAPTAEAVEKMADAVRFRDALVIRLLYQTGVRRQELADVRLEDIDRDERKIRIRSSKADSDFHDHDPERKVWYAESLDADLARWIDYGERDALYYASDSPYLFPSQRSKRLSPRRINEIVREAAEAAGLQRVLYVDGKGNDRHMITAHSLRHGFARACMTPGEHGERIDLKSLADLMGHASTDTTERYLHFADDQLKDARRLYGPQ